MTGAVTPTAKRASKVVARCAELGIRLGVDGESLTVEGPSEVMTDAVRDTLREHKAELIALLTAPTEPPPPPAAPLRYHRPPEGTPVALHQRWADLAEQHQVDGLGWRRAEQAAFEAVFGNPPEAPR